MLFKTRLLTLPFFLSAGLLSACATTNNAVITRASQIDEALNEQHAACRYNAISETLVKSLMQQSGGQEMLGHLTRMCPDLNAAFVDRRNGEYSTAVAEGSPGEAGAGNRAGRDDNGGTADSDAGTGTGGGDRSSGEASGGGESAGSSSGGGESASGGGQSTGGESDGSSGGKGGNKGGGNKGGGSHANNGGGNGSEGNSPGRGRGANNDEV